MVIKVCGITCQEDARFLVELGLDFCGFIFHPKSPRSVTLDEAARIETGDMQRVGVFVHDRIDEILSTMQKARLSYAQLHGDQSVELAQTIGPERVIRVVWPQRFCHRAQLCSALLKFAPTCAYYLLDAGTKGGGSGSPLDWAELSELSLPHPWFLAGGLTTTNILYALQETRCGGIDVNSGVESSPGKKDHTKLRTLVDLVRSRYR